MRRLVSALKEHSPIGALTYVAACVSIGSSQLINPLQVIRVMRQDWSLGFRGHCLVHIL